MSLLSAWSISLDSTFKISANPQAHLFSPIIIGLKWSISNLYKKLSYKSAVSSGFTMKGRKRGRILKERYFIIRVLWWTICGFAISAPAHLRKLVADLRFADKKIFACPTLILNKLPTVLVPKCICPHDGMYARKWPLPLCEYSVARSTGLGWTFCTCVQIHPEPTGCRHPPSWYT